ncbi:MAG: glycosyltransferase family 39 protein, partial [Actinobacteria bacterium]|nr:glycosyltransferase family 39 protein [Actinomycetota bacterium]
LTIAARLIFKDTKTKIFSPGPVRWEIVVVAMLVLLSLIMFFHPAEYVAGEGDPEYYFNNGYHLAHTGSMSVYDKSVPKMSEFEIGTFYYDGIAQFFPFHLRNRATGRIQPLLYHLLPTWIGIFIMLFGTWGGLYVVPLFALLGMLALFALARRFAGLIGATIGTLLGILFFLQVWFSRAPVSETFCQLFVLAAILFFYEFLSSKDILVGIAAAASVTAAATARPEAVVMVIPMLIVMAARMFKERYRAGDYAFVNALLLGQVYIWFYVRFAEYHYVRTNVAKVIKFLGPQNGMNIFLILWALLIGAALVFFNLPLINRLLVRIGGRVSARLEDYRQDIARSAKAALALAALATFVYLGSAPASADSPQKFFYNTALLFGGLTVFVFVAALCLLIYEMDSLGTSFLIAAFVIVNTLSLQESSLALGQFPWDARRFMLVVVPMLMVGFGYLAGRLWKTKRVELRALTIAASVCFLVLFCYYLAPIYNHTDYKGIDRQLTALSKKMDGDVVIF